MPPIWDAHAFKHHLTRSDLTEVILHANYRSEVETESDGTIVVFIGKSHELNDAEIEVLVKQFDDGRPAIIFHGMALGEKFSQYREERPDGWIN
ncbi:MAG: hypothetical protein LBN10_03915 [Propionibacteriaceae bacterium]|nr:hypothetical protein [Propionibacteriaceae bacterium]